jgi:predicted amidophosphoribosyltransferase
LGKAERQANVRGAFQVVKPETVKGARILLVDDVYTTGNTLHECARVLIEEGAAEVMALTLARLFDHGSSRYRLWIDS